MPFGWGKEFEKRTCPDGSERYVLKKIKDIGKAFSLYATDVDALFKTSLSTAMQIAEGSGEVHVKKKAQQIFENLDSVHIDAVNKFAMSYTVYMTNPCDKSAYNKLLKRVDEISDAIDKVRELDRIMGRLKAKQLGTEALNKMDAVSGIISELGEIYKPVT